MIDYLIYIAIILSVIAIGYLIRVSELSSQLKGDEANNVTDSDNKLMGKLMLVALVVLFLFTAWTLYAYLPLMLPESASEHGVDLDTLFNFNWAILFVAFALTQFLLFFFAYKYYGRPGVTARYFAHDNKLEMAWTIVPAIVLTIIIVFGLKQWNKITEPASEDAIVVQIYGKQFDWTARYAGLDNKLGQSNYKLITDENGLGLDSTCEEGLDDIIVRNEMHIPVGREVEFKLNARDVIHSVYMPHFRAQMNCVPGMTTMMHFTPILTTAEMREKPHVIQLMKGINAKRAAKGEEAVEFDYTLLCNKICGNSHYNMQMTIVVDTEEDYQKWLAEKEPFFKK